MLAHYELIYSHLIKLNTWNLFMSNSYINLKINALFLNTEFDDGLTH